MKSIIKKIKILPTILILMIICLLFKTYSIMQNSNEDEESKFAISVKTSFVNEAFADNTNISVKEELLAGTKSERKGGSVEEAKKDVELYEKGLIRNRHPKDIKNVIKDGKEEIVPTYTKEELELLKNLSYRKKELLTLKEEVDIKSKILNANEIQLNKKLDELKSLKEQLESLMAQYNEKENIKIRSLVKIYENMKPKDAAKIFEALDMTILLQVVNMMKESKVAPILSAMDPIRAKEISTEFANQKKLNSTIE